MKIQCDVCHKDEASVFCSADEAALCIGCDHRVHHANKLASKHHRFSLLHPSSCKDAPRCDICQEKRAFLFCREDRAILCRECDFNIHTANEHTQKHSRFLLTGVKLSSSTLSTTFSSTTVVGCDASSSSTKKKDLMVSVSPNLDEPPPPPPPPPTAMDINNSSTPPPYTSSTGGGGGSTSSISEYLIEMLPGWHVEDFLDSSSAPNHGFCKSTDDLLPFLDDDIIQTSLGHLAPSEDLATWVPQASPSNSHHHRFPQIDDRMNGLFKELKEVIYPKPKGNVIRWVDHGFTVPQISPPSNKRSRTLW